MQRPQALFARAAGLAAAFIAGCATPQGTAPGPVTVKLIAFNDFHGNIEAPPASYGGSVLLADPAHPAGVRVRAGGAAFLATLVKQLEAENPNHVVVGSGDMIGAAPVISTLTHDESTIDILNRIGLEVSSVGNHEFDHGQAELLRMQNGGCYPGGMVGRDTCLQGGSFPGAKFQYLAANVVDTATGKTVLPATWTRRFGPISIGFVGVTLKGTPEVVTASGVAGLSFTDEAAAINAAAAQLKAQGASAVVALIHQGGYVAPAPLEAPNCDSLAGAILPIVDALGRDVDVVVSGHTHQAYVCTRNGKLLTQAGLYGSAVTDIDLTIQPGAGVTAKAARNRPVINDLNTTGQLPPGYAILAKDPDVDAAVRRYVGASQAVRNQVVGTISADIQRALLPGFSGTVRDETAEGAMGDLMADVYLAGGPRADIAFITPGGVRADLLHGKDGTVSVNDLLTVAPFGNTLVTVDLTGAQLLRLLEQQWEAPNCSAKTGANGCGRLLHPSAGFSYAWDARTPQGAPSGQGHRVVDGSMRLNGQPIAPQASYRVTVNSFMAPGAGDNFSVLTQGAHITDSGVKDIDAFVAYMQRHPRLAPPAARVQRLH